ncbi:MAG TPA: hypothetical protein VLX58_12430 [Bryobacteraceae bacterium]|nr:hypothetical protein [Bryobacteraceae bacterium]
MSSINDLSSSYLQSILSSVLQNAGPKANNNNLSGIGPSSITPQPDHSQLSPFAQLMSTLQQLQQSDPTQYQQVTQQIATNLQNAAQAAQSQGNTAAANELNQLAGDFTNASQTGQLPNIKDLAQAIGGHHHHHHHFHADSDAASSSDSSSSSAASSANQTVSQLLLTLQGNQSQSDALNPMGIIMNTLCKAGITSSNG